MGSCRMAADKNLLLQMGVTHILNVADNVPNYYPNDFVYLNLNVADFGADKGIRRVFMEAFEFAFSVIRSKDEEKGEGRSPVMLVHCYAGVNRSVTVATALLMEIESISLRDAYDAICSKRTVACPFTDNIEELFQFERLKCGITSFESAKDFQQYIFDVQ